MSVCRVEKDRNFTVMHNFHLRDRSLSNKAKGLLSVVLSLPEDWDYSVKGLVTLSGDGFDSVKSTLKELEAAGYLVRERERDSQGHLKGMIYCFYEIPQPVEVIAAEDNTLGEGAPTEEKPPMDKPLGEGTPIEGKPTQAKPHQLSTNDTNILNKINTKDTYLLTTSENKNENLIENDISILISKKIGRPLNSIEKQLCCDMSDRNVEPELIEVAVEDNLFRKDKFDVKYVVETIEKWKSMEIETAKAARNYVLDCHVENLKLKAKEIANESNNDILADQILINSKSYCLQSIREDAIRHYKNNRFVSLFGLVKQATKYGGTLTDYLPDEIADFIEQNKNRYMAS